MQKYISFALIATLSLTQIGSLSAETGSLDAEISRINASITGSLDSAPVPIDSNPALYSPWELLHRGPMIDGFQWTGEIAQYITPHMYDGTPFAPKDIIGTTSMTDFLVEDATNYSECLTNEFYLSFGLGERIESSDILELKAIAKSCAQQFYGTYFDGKSYTTREEYLMMLLTVFGEDVSFE